MARRTPNSADGLHSIDAAEVERINLAFAYGLFDQARETAARKAFFSACGNAATEVCRRSLGRLLSNLPPRIHDRPAATVEDLHGPDEHEHQPHELDSECAGD